MVWPPRQSISLIKGARFVNDSEVELGEEKGPAGLSTRKFLFGAEVTKVVMIHPHLKGFWVAFKVMAKGLEGADNSKKFFVVDIVIKFRRLHGFGIEGNMMPTIKDVRLFEDGPEGIIASVGDEAERPVVVWESKDRGNGKGVDEGTEGRFQIVGIEEGCIFFGEVVQRVRDLRVTLNEVAVKVAEPEEGLEVFDVFWGGPFCNARNFSRVHMDLAFSNDNTKVFNGSLIKSGFR